MSDRPSSVRGTAPLSIGRYDIKQELGRGGMATVYRAHDPRFDRDVAIKILPKVLMHDESFRERFEREAKTIARLEHAAIVPVHDYGEEDEQLYIVMRFMPGGSLADRIHEMILPVSEAARIYDRLAGALDYAHERGIIHRDLKPGNILFDQHGDPYIADFGIAKLADSATLTGSTIIGTPAYMSPEQARGEPGVDGRSDIYAMGVILFEMLTGKLPYNAETPMGIAMRHITDPVPTILGLRPDLPADCEVIIRKAMAKDKDDRFADMRAMADTVSALARGEAVTVAAPAPMRPPAALAGPSIPAPVVALPGDDGRTEVISGGGGGGGAAPAAVAQPISSEWHDTAPLRRMFGRDWNLGAQFGAFIHEVKQGRTWQHFVGSYVKDMRLLATTLLLLGVGGLLRALGVNPETWSWPWFVILPGAGTLLFAHLMRGKVRGLAIPGTIVVNAGLMLFYCAMTSHWQAWAYGWPLVAICGTGMGLVQMGLLAGNPKTISAGRRLNTLGFILFLAFALFFEVVVNFSTVRLWVLPALAAGFAGSWVWNRLMERVTARMKLKEA